MVRMGFILANILVF